MPTSSLRRAALKAVLILPIVAVVPGCDDGPETPGQALDKAIQQTGDAVKRLGEDIKDAGG